uniref:maleylacetoacetate isomerase n=1 Tax=Brachionus koreanus TaxID=1199090 RepID=A0A3G2JSS5_9BILA|nr:glutathione S-transferase Z3 [Brachionus koreanus]
MPSKPVLWNFFRSSASWRVRIALALKEIEYEYKIVNLLTGEQLSEEFTKLNSKQEIPILEIDGLHLTQSLPIIEYLDETRPQEPRLIPKDPVIRCKARAIAEIINSGIQPYQNTNVLKRLVAEIGEEKKNEWLKHYLTKGFRAIETALIQSSGKYCVGDCLTIADLCLVPQVYSAHRFNVSLQDFPTILRVNAELEKIPAFQKSHAHAQIDTPDEFKGK